MIIKRRFYTLCVLWFFLMSQVFAASGDIIIENNIQPQEIQEIIIISESEGALEVQEETKTEVNEKLEGKEEEEEEIKPELEIENEEIIDTSILIPEFQIVFQNPSYILEKDTVNSEYTCDSDKEICKINIKLTTLSGGNIGSKFGCEITYSHTLETDQRCNPTTVTITEDTKITYKIFEKNNLQNFKEKQIYFKIPENNTEEIKENSDIEQQETIVVAEEPVEIVGEEKQEQEDEKEEGIEQQEEEILINEIEKTGTGSQVNTGSGMVETGTGETEKALGLFPEIILEVQSGLDYSGTGNIYTCKKQECRVNLDVTESFTGAFIAKDYECNWAFGSGTFSSSNTDKKCNPSYVNYGTGIHEVILQVSQKDNDFHFIEKYFYIYNIEEQSPEKNEPEGASDIVDLEIEKTGTGVIETGSGIIDTGSGFIEKIILFPEIVLEVQSGLEYSGSGNIYVCKKKECKINLDVSKSFTGAFEESDYICEWNFGSGSFKTNNTDKKCNPGFVDFPLGNHGVSIKIIEKENELYYIEKNIVIENKQEIIPVASAQVSRSSGKSSSINRVIDISINKQIEVQSGLDEQNTCDEEVCKINLKYDNSSFETCEWNFGNIEVLERYKTTCNPSFIYYPSGRYSIKLKITNGKVHSIHTKTLVVNNSYIPKNEVNIDSGNVEGVTERKSITQQDSSIKKVNFDIELQGKKVQYKKYIGNKIICLRVEKCSVNLKTKKSTKYQYYWDFGNGEISTQANPKSVWYNSGSYLMTLTIHEKEREIFREDITIDVIPEIVSQSQKLAAKEFISESEKQLQLSFQISENFKLESINIKNIKKIFRENNSEKLLKKTNKISKKFKKNIGKDIEYILEPKQYISWFKNADKKPKLKLTRNIYKQKKGLKFSGITLPNSTVFIVQGDNIIELQSDDSGKYEMKSTDLIPGNYNLEYYVLDEKGNFFEAKSTKNLILEEEYVVQVREKILSKKINKKSQKSTARSNSREKNMKETIDTTQYASIVPGINSQKTKGNIIFFSFLVVLSGLGSVILLRRYKII